MQKIERESKTQIYNTAYKSGIMVRKCSGVVGKLGLQQAKQITIVVFLFFTAVFYG